MKYLLIFFLLLPLWSRATCILAPPATTKNTQWQDPLTHLTWAQCPSGQMMKGKSCRGIVQKMNWLNAMRHGNSDKKIGLWELPTAAQLQAALAQCSDKQRQSYQAAHAFWSRDQLPDHALQALMVSVNGQLIHEYKTITAPVFVVRAKPSALAPVLFAEEDWIGSRQRVQKALSANTKTALAEALALEEQNKPHHAQQIYEQLLLRPKAQALNSTQKKLVEKRLAMLNAQTEKIP